MQSYSDLPEEIIFNILSRLPTKSVGVCRCVSKPWRALLSQPNFIETHLQFTKINSLASFAIIDGRRTIYYAPLNSAHHMFDEITLPLRKLSFVGYNPHHWHDIYGSCNGLLLVSNTKSNLFVMNPITREIRQAPYWPLALPHLVNFWFYGFGYDSVSDDYKIVITSHWCITKNAFVTDDTFIDVYSLKTGFWKRLEISFYHCVGLREGAFVGGCINWLIDDGDINDRPVILAFNLADNKLREVLHPSSIVDDVLQDYALAVIGGCLCMYANKNGEVWVMKEYGIPESWTKLTVNNPRGSFECFFDGQEQGAMVVNASRNYAIWNMKQGTLKETAFNKYIRAVGSFVESLVSPHGDI